LNFVIQYISKFETKIHNFTDVIFLKRSFAAAVRFRLIIDLLGVYNYTNHGLTEVFRRETVMAKERTPVTPGILFMKKNGINFTLRPYRYEEHGGTNVASRELGVDENMVIKTLVMEEDGGKPLIILMHGDKKVSTKSLARVIGVKSVSPCDPHVAEKHTGYRVGGTSPFGTKHPLRIFMEESIADLPKILINAGSRGLLAEMAPAEMIRTLSPVSVKVAK
jgi:Cys-tRNA(Pro) deacylase